jgi:hypothetical protein
MSGLKGDPFRFLWIFPEQEAAMHQMEEYAQKVVSLEHELLMEKGAVAELRVRKLSPCLPEVDTS